MDENKKSPQVARTTSEDSAINSCKCTCKYDAKKIARKLYNMHQSTILGSVAKEKVEARKKEHVSAINFGKAIVKTFEENNFTIRQSKTALDSAKTLLEDVTIRQVQK